MRHAPVRASALASGVALVAALALGGCGTASEVYESTGIDQLEIPTPSPDVDDFVRNVDNPWLPLEPGSTWTYDGTLGDSTVTVGTDRPVVGGVPVTVVTTTRGETATVDYYAQDRDGNVWWFGREGEWDVDAGAEAGLAMPADPRVGDGWRAAYLPGVVEDRLTVDAIDGDTVTLVRESDLRPGGLTVEEYAAGYGLVSRTGPLGTDELASGP